MSIGFRVDDLERAVNVLRAKNVDVTMAKDGFLRRADFADPDGHMLYLMQLT